MVKVKYVDKSPTTKIDCTTTCSDKQGYVNLADLNNDNSEVTQYASFEWNRTILNGNFSDFPTSAPNDQIYISNSISNENGVFATPIVLTRTFSQQHTSPGITFTFDKNDDKCWCSELNIKWYRGNELLENVDFYPNNTFFFCSQNVTAFNKMVITFKRTNKSFRHLRIFNIDDGVERIFAEDELFELRIIEEISESSDTLSINSAEIGIASKEDVDYVFQRTQPIYVYNDGTMFGKVFNNESAREAYNQYSIYAEDYIGILDKEQFLGGIYNNYSLKSLLDNICVGIPHDYVGNETITGYLPVMTRREALQYVAFAKCKVIDCSRSKVIKIRTLSNVPISIDRSRVIQDSTRTIENIVTKITLAEHSLKPNSEASELINEIINGIYTYTWGEPHHTYSITGGTIVESGSNYVTIAGTGSNVVLSAYGYDDVIRLLNRDNPLVVATDLPNVVEKTSNCLINSSNSTTVLNHLSNIYFRNKYLNVKILLGNEVVGDLVNIPTEMGDITGRIITMEIDLVNQLATLNILEV